MFPTKFRNNRPFSSRKEAQIDFQDGRHDLGFPIRMILAIFDLQVTPMLPIFRVDWPFWFRRRCKKYSDHLGLAAILFIRAERFWAMLVEGHAKEHEHELFQNPIHWLRRRQLTFFFFCFFFFFFFSIFSSGCHNVHPSGKFKHFGSGSPKEHLCEIISKFIPLVKEERSFKVFFFFFFFVFFFSYI